MRGLRLLTRDRMRGEQWYTRDRMRGEQWLYPGVYAYHPTWYTAMVPTLLYTILPGTPSMYLASGVLAVLHGAAVMRG